MVTPGADAPVPAFSTPYARANPLHRLGRFLAGTGPVSRVYIRVLHHLDRAVFRATRGRATFASLGTGLPVIMLTTTGARSGQPRTVPVLGVPLDAPLPSARGSARGAPGRMVVLASNWGQRSHPGWYHNLVAHPDASVATGGHRWAVRARPVEEDERERLWRAGLAVYPAWAAYARRAAPRTIPLLVLEPA
ncbi:nitroreductase family deazaflavin-dependent oxidoreductase [Geodermatophilus sp. SYSU D00815]